LAIQRKIFTKAGYFLDQTETWSIIMAETKTISFDITDTRLNTVRWHVLVWLTTGALRQNAILVEKQ